MPIIPETLKARTIQKPLTVSETAIVKQYGSLEAKKQSDLQSEVSNFNQNLSYENYKEKYNQLSPQARALVKAPQEVFSSQDYQTYQSQKAEQNAYNTAVYWLERKLQGKRVSMYGYNQNSREIQIFMELASKPEIRNALDQATELSQAARASGFSSIKEYMGVGQNLLGSSFKPLSVLEKPKTDIVTIPTTTTTTYTPAPERTTLSALRQVGSNLFYNVKQFASGEPQYISKPFSPLEDIKERWIGGQEVKETYLLGDKELQLYPTDIPTMGGKGTSITSFGVSDIKVDGSARIIRKAEEYIPVAGTALTAFQENVYLPTIESGEKFNTLISSKKPGAAKELRIFLRNQEVQYKKDIGQYNLLQAQLSTKEEVTQDDINEINTLGQRIERGYKGTLKDVTRTAVQEKGTTGAALLYGGLRLGQTAYGIEKTYLGFQLGGALAGGLLPAGVTSAIAGSRTVSTLGRLYVPGLFGGAALRTGTGFVKGEYAPEYLGESAGILFGGLGSYYSKPIVEGSWRLTKATGRGLKFAGERLGQTGYQQPKLVAGKRGSTQMYGGQVAESEYAYGGDLYKKRLKQFKDYVNRIKETKTFDKSGKEVIVKTFPSAQEKFDRLKPFLDKLNRGDPNKVRDFMKLVRETIGDDLARDFFIQEGLMLPKVRTTERPDALKFFDSSFGERVKPRIRQQVVATQSPYYGRGLYERTESILPTKSKTDSSTNDVMFGGLFKTGLGLGIAGRFGIGQKGMLKTQTIESSKSKEEQVSIQRFALSTSSLSVTKEKSKFKQPQQEGQISAQVFRSPAPTEQPQIQEPSIGFPKPRPREPEPRKPIEPIKKPFGFEIQDFERKKKGFIDKPYDAFVRVDATKKTKARWVLVADNVPLVTALSKGGGFVDETASNRFKVEPTKGKLNRIVDVAWNQLSNKFREYSQKGGVKVGLRPGHYIEKRKYRIDSPQERRAIPQAGRVAIARKFGRI